MGVYRPHQAKALLLPDNGSYTGNKSYGSDFNFLNQPLNLLSKNRDYYLTAKTETPDMALSSDTLTRLPCYGSPFPEGLEDQQHSRFINNIIQEEHESKFLGMTR